MTRPTRAYVMFPDGGRQYRYLVGVDQVKDFRPVSLEDFDEDAVYNVKWQKSDLHGDGYYPASIIMLGMSDKEIMLACKERNIKVPQVLPALPDSKSKSSSSSSRRRSSTKPSASLQDGKSGSKAPAPTVNRPTHGHKSARINSSTALSKKVYDAKKDSMERAMQMHSEEKQSSPLKTSRSLLQSPHSKGKPSSPLKTSRSLVQTPHSKKKTSSPLKTSRSPVQSPHRSPLKAKECPSSLKKVKPSQSPRNKKLDKDGELQSWVVKRKDAPSSSQSEDLRPPVNTIVKQEPLTPPKAKAGKVMSNLQKKKRVLVISSDDDDDIRLDDPTPTKQDEDDFVAGALSSADEDFDKLCDTKFSEVDPNDVTTEEENESGEEEEGESGEEEEKEEDSRDEEGINNYVDGDGEMPEERPNIEGEREEHVATGGNRIEDDSKRVVKRLFNDLTATGTNSSKRLKPMPGNKAEVHLGYGMGINKELWENKIRGAKKQASAVNYLTGYLWGSEERKDRTVSGKSKNRTVVKATPKKVHLIDDFVKARLLAKKVTDREAAHLAVNKAHVTMDSKFYETYRTKVSLLL
ncbi:hypothetical protein ONE63_008146 [Megalurothrips usitatus]|uniref:Uncharacterized protein n=1 Tax=Megalurothrips usitatus TaxID=439358 RepID=A0AAV7XK88_9NEOP|nr:hypothetical protein ONE63_008146 [Megalurothrips usitatus]